MEFDHVKGGKRHNISAMSSWKHETVLEEIEKCEPVCANCHRVRTAARRVDVGPSFDLPAWKYNKAIRQRDRIAAFRAWLVVLKNNPCHDCTRIFHPAAMDFDHMRGEKLFSIANGWQWTREEVEAEIAKCDLVCACCHRLRTEERRVQEAA